MNLEWGNNLKSDHRAAGKVKRWHTEHTLQTQTISDHVYNLMRIYFHIWGSPSYDEFIGMIYHDFEEVIIGDIPHWAACRPKMKLIKEQLEEEVRENYGIPITSSYRIQMADWIEAVEFMVDEVNFGNDTLRAGVLGLWTKLSEFAKEFTEEDQLDIKLYLADSFLEHKVHLIIDGVHRG